MAHNPTYIMIPRKLVFTALSIVVVLFLGNIGSLQYANWVDRRSNRVWCTIVNLFNEAYQANPPPSPLGKQIAIEMSKLPHKFSC